MLQWILKGSVVAAVLAVAACSSNDVGDPLSADTSPLVLGPPISEVPQEGGGTARSTREPASRTAATSSQDGAFKPEPVELVVTQSGEVVRKGPSARGDRAMPPSPGRLTDAIRSGKTGLDLNVDQARAQGGTVVRDEKTRREVFLPQPVQTDERGQSASDLNRASAQRLAEMRRLRQAGDTEEADARQRQANARQRELAAAERREAERRARVAAERERIERMAREQQAERRRAAQNTTQSVARAPQSASDLNRASTSRLEALRREREVYIDPKAPSTRDVRGGDTKTAASEDRREIYLNGKAKTAADLNRASAERLARMRRTRGIGDSASKPAEQPRETARRTNQFEPRPLGQPTQIARTPAQPEPPKNVESLNRDAKSRLSRLQRTIQGETTARPTPPPSTDRGKFTPEPMTAPAAQPRPDPAPARTAPPARDFASLPKTTPAPPPAAPVVSSGDGSVYLLGPGDEIRMDVFNEPTLSGTYTVDPSGSVSLPLIGQQQAAGRSLRQFEGDVTTALNYYLINPRVNLDLAKFRPFYIHGEVTNGGEYPYASGMHVLTAIGMAGGYTYRANKKRVYIIRQGSGQEVEFKASVDTMILPGDVVRIPERRF